MFKLKIFEGVDVELYVTGTKGDVELEWPNNKPVPTGGVVQEIGHLSPLGNGKNWGWIYLGFSPGRFDFQLYRETQNFGDQYAFFGWYNPDSTESNSNPSPFPAGVAEANSGTGVYTLLRVPPK